MKIDGEYKKTLDLTMEARYGIFDSGMCIALFSDPEDAKQSFKYMCDTFPNIAHLFKLEELS